MPTPELSVKDVFALGDAELVQYIKDSCRPNGGFELSVEGWGCLPKNQREQLAERLR